MQEIANVNCSVCPKVSHANSPQYKKGEILLNQRRKSEMVSGGGGELNNPYTSLCLKTAKTPPYLFPFRYLPVSLEFSELLTVSPRRVDRKVQDGCASSAEGQKGRRCGRKVDVAVRPPCFLENRQNPCTRT